MIQTVLLCSCLNSNMFILMYSLLQSYERDRDEKEKGIVGHTHLDLPEKRNAQTDVFVTNRSWK